jgi:predicted Na+-dependent transporter
MLPLENSWYQKLLVLAIVLGVGGGVSALLIMGIIDTGTGFFFGDSGTDWWTGKWWWIPIFPLSQGLSIGLLLIGLAAGAPFLPKLAEVAKGDRAFSVGLMVLLMVVTIVFLPVFLPLLLPGVEVKAWDIARSLIVLMLIPLVIGLLVRWRYPAAAASLAPFMSQASSLALIVLTVAFFIAFFQDLIGVIGTTAIIASIFFILVSFVIGYLLGGSDGPTKRVLGVGTAQRNLSAAVAVAGLNFTDPDILIMVLVVALVGLVLLMIIGGELGKWQQ